MDNEEVAAVFNQIADILEIRGENPFRVRSYRNAAAAIEGLAVSLDAIFRKNPNELETIPGIGKSLHEKIEELLTTGRLSYHEKLLKETPAGLLEELKVSGLGPKKVKRLYQELGIASVEELYDAAKGGKLSRLDGFGKRSEEKILKALDNYKVLKKSSSRFYISVALDKALAVISHLKKHKGVSLVEYAGSLRRWKETIGDVDLLAVCKESARHEDVMEHFVAFKGISEIISRGTTKSSVKLKGGMQLDLRLIEEGSFGAAMQYFTGSKEHNVEIRTRAKKKGLKVSEYGVFDEKTGKTVAAKSEEDVYGSLGLEWITPELRENSGEIEASEAGRLPGLVAERDIRGDLHCHTSYSDGSDSVEELAAAAIDFGYEYIAITDHSKAVGVARGLDEKRLLDQLDEIDAINRRLGKKGQSFRLIKGAEVDIKADGSLDYSPEVLERLELVVGAVHSGFDMERGAMTERIIRAMESGYLNILAHPTGRLINVRRPYELDIEQVVLAARKYGVLLEVNSHPERLDLKDSHCRLARDSGVMLAISTDLHAKDQLDNVSYGVHTARRGWVEKKDVLNTRPLKELMRLLKKGLAGA